MTMKTDDEEVIAEIDRRYGPSPTFRQPESITSWSQGAIARDIALRLRERNARIAVLEKQLGEVDNAWISETEEALAGVSFTDTRAAYARALQRDAARNSRRGPRDALGHAADGTSSMTGRDQHPHKSSRLKEMQRE